MKILHVTPSYYPAVRWGGPIFSTKAIVDWIARNREVELRVLTTNAAGPGRDDVLALEAEQTVMPEGYEVIYKRRVAGNGISPGLLAALPGGVRRADIVHLTATYSFPTLPTLLVARLMGKPVVWSPRGAIQASAEWEDAPHQGLKRAFERVAAALAPRGTVLHVTGLSEARATARRMPGFAIATIPNSVDISPIEARLPAPEGATRLLFLSRVHEKKGLSVLVEVMRSLPPSFVLDIYGTGEPDYLAQLHREIAAADLTGRIAFHGQVDGAEKAAVFASADIFVLPSFSENFGIVVAEALAHGVPVVTTDRTPWTELDDRECGRCVPLETDALCAAISGLAASDVRTAGKKGRVWMAESFSPDAIHAAMYEVYAAAVEARRSGRPITFPEVSQSSP